MRCGAMRWGGRRSRWGGLDWAGGAGLAPGVRAEEVVWRGERQASRQRGRHRQDRQTSTQAWPLAARRPPARLLRTTLKNWGPRAAPGLLATLLPTYDRTTGVAPAIACSLFFFHCINSFPSFRVVARPACNTYIHTYIAPARSPPPHDATTAGPHPLPRDLHPRHLHLGACLAGRAHPGRRRPPARRQIHVRRLARLHPPPRPPREAPSLTEPPRSQLPPRVPLPAAAPQAGCVVDPPRQGNAECAVGILEFGGRWHGAASHQSVSYQAGNWQGVVWRGASGG